MLRMLHRLWIHFIHPYFCKPEALGITGGEQRWRDDCGRLYLTCKTCGWREYQ